MWRLLTVLLLLATPAWAQGSNQAQTNQAPGGIEWRGDFSQGGLVQGHAAAGLKLKLGDRDVPLGPNGEFVFGFGRDEPAEANLSIRAADGRETKLTLSIAKRQYDIQRIDGLPPAQVTPPPELLERIKRENAKIAAARQINSPRLDFLAGWVWPADGPVSGVYGSQRILNGEPRQPHFGLDIAAPTGTPVRASTGGVVTFADKDVYYTGGTVIIDHGHGINGAYSHLSRIDVKVGQQVKQGEQIGAVGATGRATGPHLDWRVNWFDVRLDPQRLLPPR
jgi:murein DD-endopeptidase MepM/ murein hydrolase activator NlpD